MLSNFTDRKVARGALRSHTLRGIHRWSTLPFGSQILADQRPTALRRQRISAV